MEVDGARPTATFVHEPASKEDPRPHPTSERTESGCVGLRFRAAKLPPLAVTTVTRLEALPHISTVGDFGAGRLVIHPDECTDCGVCEPARAS